MMQQVYGSDCLSRATINEWFRNQKNRAWKNEKSKHCSSLSSTPRELFIKNLFHLAKRLMLCIILVLWSVYSPVFVVCGQNIVKVEAGVCCMIMRRLIDRHWWPIFLIKNHILTLNHSPYLPDLAPCYFYLFGKLHLAMKEKRYKDVEHIQTATTSILKMIPANGLKKSFDMLFERAKLCIDSAGDYFEANK